MHVLITADTVGGVWTYTRELVIGLTRRGARVTLVSFGEIPAPGQTQWMSRLENLDYRPTGFKLEWMQDCEADLAASAEYLGAVIGESKPDMVHLSQFYYGGLDCAAPRVVVAHSDVVSWWMAVHGQEPPDSPWMRWYRRAVIRGITGATAVVAPSKWMLDQVVRYYARPSKSAVIYNGRTPLLFNPHMSKEDTIASVGRLWDSGKNAQLLFRQDLPAPVCLVGADHSPESRAESSTESWSGRGRVPGVQVEDYMDEKHLSLVLAKTAIYAATSRYEPFGLAPVEAALSRCAIVASDIPSFRELWEGAAVFFRDNDAESLKEALETLTNNAALRQSCANLAYNHARQKFHAGRMVDDYLALYQELVG